MSGTCQIPGGPDGSPLTVGCLVLGGYTNGFGGSAGAGGGGGFWHSLVSKVCSAVPDAVTDSAGYNAGFGWSPTDFNVSATSNGVSGEYTVSLQVTDTKGVVAPGAAVGGSFTWNAPTNAVITNSSAPTYNIGLQRYGVSFTPGTSTIGATIGPSLSPVTVDVQTTRVSKSLTIPYLGYVGNLPKALCTLVAGKKQ